MQSEAQVGDFERLTFFPEVCQMLKVGRSLVKLWCNVSIIPI